MKDVVTFQTAKRLKEAGFPQHISNNDCWYAANGDCFLQWHGGDIWIGGEMPITREVDAPFFAPTATDIIRDFERLQKSKWIRIGMSRDGYECYLYAFGGIRDSFCHENPAEACAEAWLKHKE